MTPPTSGVATGQRLGDLLARFHPDTLIHLTNDREAAFSSGVDEETSFARLGDVVNLTVSTYQANVVGSGAVAGPGQPVSGFGLALAGTPGAFGRVPIANYANVPEYVNTRRVLPDAYVAIRDEEFT